MTVIVQQLVPILGALGLAGLITQWFAAAKDRRASRAAVLNALAAAEAARWATGAAVADFERLRSALRDLETALLIARLPRSMVAAYAPVAFAALWYVQADVERYGDPEEASIDPPLHDAVRYAAETISRAVWSGPTTRRVRASWRGWRFRRQVAKLTKRQEIKPLLDRGRAVTE
jgi:hypothetical protein